MKIGLFGNTNNSLFSLAEALRGLGHEVLLILDRKELLHRPENIAPEFFSGYPDWIMDASGLQDRDYFVQSENLQWVTNRLACCDGLILNSLGPSLLSILNVPSIAFLTGSDLEYYANPEMIEARTKVWTAEYKASSVGKAEIQLTLDFIHRQRMGIRKAVAVRYFPRGLVPAGDRLLDELGISGHTRLFCPAAVSRVKFVPPPHNNPIQVFCATRLTWKLPIEIGTSSLDYKGSDVMIRGLGAFYRSTGVRLDIQLVRKGQHVKELEQVIAEEGITGQITWSDEMSLLEVRDRYAKSDIVIEQLGDSLIGGAGIDAMATGRPVIGNMQPAWFESIGAAPPICQARTSAEVHSQLQRLVFDHQERERIGRASHEYVKKNLDIKRAAECFMRRLEDGALS
jgi:glycosyltransferase involved in cell wall biosynthesis